MRTVPAPEFATPAEAVRWQDAPERVPLVWRDQNALALIDGLLAKHGLEIVLYEQDGDPWGTIEPRAR